MSLSANDNGSYSRVPSSGKTPPPASSAAFAAAKRLSQMQAGGDLGGARYRPPALRVLASGGSPPNDGSSSVATSGDGSTLPPTNYPPGFRRARAGTLPSNVELAAQQRFTESTNTLSNTHHPTSVATERTSRLRAGSLTLPSAGLTNAFGSSLFSSPWMPSTNNGGSGIPVLEERSVTSGDSETDAFDVHTLNYLGLDDHRPPAATLSELRNQAQAAIANNLTHPNRMRASTVSTYGRRPQVGSLISAPAPEVEEDYFVGEYDDHGYNRQHLTPSYETPTHDNGYTSSYLNQGLRAESLTATRPRAISVGTLDDPVRSITRRATTAAETLPYLSELTHQTANLNLNNLGNPSILKPDNKLAGSRTSSSPSVHFPNGEASGGSRGASAYLLAPNNQPNQNRSVSPKSEGQSSQIQTPTRSLWIGNLDSSVSSEQLIHVFAPYGAIESLRLLPEKECGFVNFVDQADAIRAKDDVLNRLGGNINMPNGQLVRIGFGKADSAPVAPAKGTPVSPSPTSPNNAAGKTASANGGLNSMDAQLQSTPTRALWIGSIPSSTTPATILSVFSPYGPIESARVLTHKNCGFINFERLDDAVRARKALNGRDVLGSDVGAIRIGFAKVPVKNGQEGAGGPEESSSVVVQGVGDLSVGATIHALRNVKGASTIPADQQVLGGAVENYRSNLLLSMIGSGIHNVSDGLAKPPGLTPSVTEQQMIMRELSAGSLDAEPDIQALAEFRPPTMYYTTIPLVSERTNNRRWDAAKLRELRKRLDSGSMGTEEIDQVTNDFMDGEIVDLASDWLGNTVVQKLFEKCSSTPRFAMLERLAPHLAMIGIHKNGTWAAQKIIECVSSPEEIALVAQNLRAYAPPLLLDQFGNYVVQCCLRFGQPANDFIFDAIVDRMWEIAQGRFGARSMRACLESPHITVSQQRRIATAVILNSIPLATNPNGALLLTWLLDTSNFPSRYNLLAPRFTPHLSHLCTHKLASLTVLRIVNQKTEPSASRQIVEALFNSLGDHVLTDVLGDQVNGVAVVHKILTSSFIDPIDKQNHIEATKRVLIELKVIATQAYRRLIEEVGLQMGGQNPQAGPSPIPLDTTYTQPAQIRRHNLAAPVPAPAPYAPPVDPFSPFGARTPDASSPRQMPPRSLRGPLGNGNIVHMPPNYGAQSPAMPPQHANVLGVGQPQPQYGGMPQQLPPHVYQPYMYQTYQQNPANNMGGF
ncbi:Pumilio domain-containing protein C56F2.08c [Leucoagaricus sp. SymC.cos]|nr:Pumilio domain-containing protein C56F2.08c [Leucoagaricus sp. SymC.cos]